MAAVDDISIFILSYNRPHHLKRCIESCLKYAAGSKISVLDNSDDITSLQNLKTVFPSTIDWHFSQKTLGYAKNFYRAFDLCQTKYLVALHDDDCITAEYCEAQMACLQANHKVSAVSCSGYFLNDTGQRTRIMMPYFYGNEGLKFFRNISDYVRHKYCDGGGCIPFSPMMFDRDKADFIKNLIIQRDKEFGQAIDSALIVDLLRVSEVILNLKPLYLCGEHDGQDSNSYSNKWEVRFMLSLVRDGNIPGSVKAQVRLFYMSDMLITIVRAVISKASIRHLELNRELIALWDLPRAICVVIGRSIAKIKNIFLGER